MAKEKNTKSSATPKATPKAQPNTVPVASRPSLTPPKPEAPAYGRPMAGAAPKPITTPITRVSTTTLEGIEKASSKTTPLFTGPIPVGATRTATGYVTAQGTTVTPGSGPAALGAPGAESSVQDKIDVAKAKIEAAKKKAADAKAKIDAAKDKLKNAKDKTGTDVTEDTPIVDTSAADNEVIQALQDQINQLNQALADQANSFAEQLAQQKEAAKLQKQEGVRTALEDFTLTLNAAGLGDLAADVDRMIKNDYTAAQIKIEIRTLDTYKNRFPGMESLSKKNRAISEGAYIDLERGYTQILRSYGLDDKIYGERGDLGTYIANEVSAREFEERVGLAKNKVDQQPEVTQALADFYGISKTDAVGFILNPLKAMDVIKKQVRASEIGAAASRYKFTFGATQEARQKEAEALIGATGTTDFAGLTQEFGRARTLADTQSKLSAIESETYNELEAVQAVVGGSQEALLKSKRRAERETMLRFGGTSGVGGTSLRRSNIQ